MPVDNILYDNLGHMSHIILVFRLCLDKRYIFYIQYIAILAYVFVQLVLVCILYNMDVRCCRNRNSRLIYRV